MTDIPEDIRKRATQCFADVDFVDTVPEAIEIIAQALTEERQTQRDRAVKILVGIADILAKRVTDNATPELLKALADAVNASEAAQTP
jgi:hypothetical protein